MSETNLTPKQIDAIKDYTEYMSLAEKVKETGVV